MILVTGATGSVGRQVLEQLVAAVQPVRPVARDPDRASCQLTSSADSEAGNGAATPRRPDDAVA